jgi:hypothetical protein
MRVNCACSMLDLRRYEKDMVIHVADPRKVKEYFKTNGARAIQGAEVICRD